MKSKDLYLYVLSFCRSIFSFAVFISPQSLSLNNIIFSLVFSGLVYIIFTVCIFNDKTTKPLADLFSLFYILLLAAKRIYQMNSYIKMYHRQTSIVGNTIISLILIVAFTALSAMSIKKITPVAASMVFILIAVIVVLNIKNFNPVNLYKNSSDYQYEILNITMFDYLIPLNIAVNNRQKNEKYKAVSFIIISILFFISICIFAHGSLRGDLMYSISPLQILFQISSGKIINNFDAVFNYLLYFAYFAYLLLISAAYSRIKNRFGYFGKGDLFFVLLFLLLVPEISSNMWFLLQLAAGLVLISGRKKEKSYEKN